MVATEDLNVSKIFSVKDYVCVVTGGGSGIGLMATQALAANGLEVLENAAKTHSPSGGGAIIPVGPCDVTSKQDLDHLVDQISQKEKHVNLLVTSAGISGPKVEPNETDATELKQKLWSGEDFDQWAEVYSTNVSAVYFTTVAFLPLLQAATSRSPGHSAGVIVISSMSGIMRVSQGHFSYNAAKGATVHLTKLMSAEFEKVRIRVNSIAPGYFPSEMTAKESDENQKSELPAEKVQEKGHVPAQRAGHDEEMAQAVLFLTKNMYVNGEVIAVDGGALLKVPS